jgi:hypothetical protein
MGKGDFLYTKLFRMCLVLGVVIAGVQISGTEAMDGQAMLAQIHIDWAPLTNQLFRVSDIHIGDGELRVDTENVLVYEALMFTLEAKAAFPWDDIPSLVRFYDADNRELLSYASIQFDPPDLMSTGWTPGTRCQASVSLSTVALSQVRAIRFSRATEE